MSNATVGASALSNWHSTLRGADRSVRSSCGQMLNQIDALLAENPKTIRLSDYVALLENIGQSCKPSALSWSTGQVARLPFDGELGNAILGCKSLGTALHWLCHYFPLLQDASALRLDMDEDWTTLSYKILDPAIWPRHEDAMYTLGICSMLIKAAAPDVWNQVQITVEAEPAQINTDLESIVNTSVIHGGNANLIRFPTGITNAPLRLVPQSPPEVSKKLSADLTRKKRAMPFAERTRQMIYQEMNDGCVNQDFVARELGVSSRTLRRRLSIENQSFQKLLDECRMQFAALEFRTRRNLSLSDMALKLGYSEHSTFSRAFGRWAGMAPQDYRRGVALH